MEELPTFVDRMQVSDEVEKFYQKNKIGTAVLSDDNVREIFYLN